MQVVQIRPSHDHPMQQLLHLGVRLRQDVIDLALIAQVSTITLILTRHRLAPLAAASAGFPLALGFLSAHWLPHWSELSDPVWQIDSFGWFSYLASTLEIVGALAVGFAGLAIVRSRGLDSFAAPGTPASEPDTELPVPSGR